MSSSEEASNPSQMLLGAMLALAEEAGSRPVRLLDPRVVVLASTELTEGLGLLTPGAVVVVVAAPNSPIYDSMFDATEPQRLAGVARGALSLFSDALASGTVDASMPENICEIRYGSKTLGAQIVLRKGQAYADAFPYTGGTLEAEQFALIDFPSDSAALAPRCLVIICPPELSDLERAVLDVVPSASSEINVSTVPMLVPTTAAAAAMATQLVWREAARRAAIGLARTAARGQGRLFHARDEEQDAERSLPDLGAEPSVRELLRERRRVLAHKYSQ